MKKEEILQNDPKIGFIGGGNMTGAILERLISTFTAADLFVADLNEERVTNLKEKLHINTSLHFTDFIEKVDVVVLAIKPQGFPELLQELKSYITKNKLIISIAAGVSTSALSSAFEVENLSIIRVMPNTPSSVGFGATGLYANEYSSSHHKNIAESIFKACGLAIWVNNEEDISTVIALSGSSPAYFFYIMEIMIKVGIEMGLSEDRSSLLVKQAMLGAAKLSQISHETPDVLKISVMSPQGTTEKAILSFEKNHLEEIFREAMLAAYKRDQELSTIISNQIIQKTNR